MEKRYNNVINAYITIKRGDEDIATFNDKLEKEGFDAISQIQRNLDVQFDLSCEIMKDACYIISEKTLSEDTKNSDGIWYEDMDLYADADAITSVYTGVQLSYLSVNNEAEISDLMKDEAIPSIAQACSIWYSQKVAEACDALLAYIKG